MVERGLPSGNPDDGLFQISSESRDNGLSSHCGLSDRHPGDCTVRQVNVDRGATLYCSNMKEHAHFCCDDCGKVFDVNLKNLPRVPELEVSEEFEVRSIDIALHGRCTGTCANCGRKEIHT